MPNKVVELLKADLPDVRINAAQLIKKHSYQKAEQEIVKQLAVETDPAVISCLLDSLAVFHPKLEGKIIEEYLVNPKPILRIAAISCKLRLREPKNSQIILNFLHELLLQQEAKIRFFAIKSITDFKIHGFKNKIISLISDSGIEVSKQAIAVALQKITEAIPIIITKFEKQKMFIQAMKALVAFDATAIPRLQ